LGERLRVLGMYTSTAGNGGDEGEFVVLTNLDASAALDLSDVKIVAWNSKKKSEAEPSLAIALDGVAIPKGGTLTLEQATSFGGGKLTNSKVGLKIYDPAGACAQEVEVDADWWEKACDGTGAHFVAVDFGATVREQVKWRPSFLPSSDADGKAAISAAIAADARVKAWMDALGATEGGQAAITAFAGSAETVKEAYLVGLDTLGDPEADLVFVDIKVDAEGRVTLDGDLSVLGGRWRRKVNGTLRLYRYESLGGEPDVVELGLEGDTFPLVGAEGDSTGAYRFFRLSLE